MPGLSIMLPIAVGIALFFLIAFLWSLANGEYDDTEMMKYRLLMDDADDVDRTINAEVEKKESVS